ncbi:MAG: hypothetical protein AMJ60_03485 [Desulfobacterales bacterium SG8_35]|nr:MAG: hypothetical protein AMJ60_03485 [Desulfobacterales bacterium SG8_35]
MSQTARKISAAVLLVLLIGVPFIDWKLGAVLWMCAWLIFIFQNLFPGHSWKFGDENAEDEEEEEP